MSTLETRPRSVALIALGPSSREYVQSMCAKKDPLVVDETWGVNTAHRCYRVDKAWVMDDLKRVEAKYPQWASELRRLDTPVITPYAYPEYASAVAFPFEEVRACVRDDYFTTTIAYMIGYAIWTGVEELFMYGADFWYPNGAQAESGLGCVGYLLGIAKERGLNYKIPNTSTLLDAHMVELGEDGRPHRKRYGYEYNPGDSFRKVQRGQATALDHAVAQKAYVAVPPKKVKTDGAESREGA